MKRGNKPSFKKLGSSPLHNTHHTTWNPYGAGGGGAAGGRSSGRGFRWSDLKFWGRGKGSSKSGAYSTATMPPSISPEHMALVRPHLTRFSKGFKKHYPKVKRYVEDAVIFGGGVATGMQAGEEVTDVEADKAGKKIHDAITGNDVNWERYKNYAKEQDYDFQKAVDNATQYREELVNKGIAKSKDDANKLLKNKDSKYFNSDYAVLQSSINKIINAVNQKADTAKVITGGGKPMERMGPDDM